MVRSKGEPRFPAVARLRRPALRPAHHGPGPSAPESGAAATLLCAPEQFDVRRCPSPCRSAEAVVQLQHQIAWQCDSDRFSHHVCSFDRGRCWDYGSSFNNTHISRARTKDGVFNCNTAMVARPIGVRPMMRRKVGLQRKCSSHESWRGWNSGTSRLVRGSIPVMRSPLCRLHRGQA